MLFKFDKEFTAYIDKCRGKEDSILNIKGLKLTNNEKYFRRVGGHLSVIAVSSIILALIATILKLHTLPSIFTLIGFVHIIAIMIDLLYLNNRNFDGILHSNFAEKHLIRKDALNIYSKGEK